MVSNAFFFHTLNAIGGVETMFYELVKKYASKYEIVVYYVGGDTDQIARLRQYTRVKKFEKGQRIQCQNAFFNYNLEPMIDYIDAEHYYQIIHADFSVLSIKPTIDPRIEKCIAVSQSVADAYYKRTGIQCEVCANPLTLESETAPLFLCSAQRLTNEKGGKRIEALVKRLDQEDIPYYWLIFTNMGIPFKSKNVVKMPHRLDVRPFIYGCDVFVALTDTEGRSYSTAEKLGFGTGKLLITPVPSFFEQGCNDKNSIVMQFDMSNMDEVVEELRKLQKANKRKKGFPAVKVEDDWERWLAPGGEPFTGVKMIRVRATDVYQRFGVYDVELGRVPHPGECWEVDEYRFEHLRNWKQGALVEIDGTAQEDIQD